MARSKKNAQGTEKTVAKSIELAERGIQTGAQFASVMSALLTDHKPRGSDGYRVSGEQAKVSNGVGRTR